MKVLAFLGQEPSRSYYQREIARLAGVSVGKANQVLRELEREGIVVKETRGKMNLYRYDLRSPVARSLKSFFTLTEISDLVKKLGPVSRKIVLFGSCAEGTDTAESDIDLFILSRDKEKARKIIDSTRRTLGRRVSPIVIDALEYGQLKDRDRPLHEQVSRGMVIWQEEQAPS